MKESIHTLVMVVEIVTFVTAVAIGVFVWRISRRDSQRKKQKSRR